MKTKLITVTIIVLVINSFNIQSQSLTWLGTLGGNTSRAFDISGDGLTVVGIAQDSGGLSKAFKWKSSLGMVNLGTLGGNSSSAVAVSAIGEAIAGTAEDSTHRTRAFIYQNGIMTDIDLSVTGDTYANYISPNGSMIVGAYQDNNSNTKAYYYDAGSSIVDIGTLGGESSEAFAISGGVNPIIVGGSQTSNFEFHAFRKSGNQMDDLGTLGGDYSAATGISENKDFIVGYSNGSNHNDHAFIWTDSAGIQDIGTLGGSRSEAWSVSDNATVVGLALTPNGQDNAFVWSPDSGMQNLNVVYSNLIPSTGKLMIARSISADGRYIVGTGYQSNPERYEAFLLDRGELTFVEKSNTLPDNYYLAQNYPNPFNPTTTIQYSIPKSSNVEVKIYDVLGNEVATLVNEYKPAGSYKVNFDAKGLSSGVYFYRLQAGNFVETKKMILLH